MKNPYHALLMLIAGATQKELAARLAKQLCSLAADESSCVMRLAAIEAAEGRLPRAERIARHISDSG
jgi:hypothetical protein